MSTLSDGRAVREGQEWRPTSGRDENDRRSRFVRLVDKEGDRVFLRWSHKRDSESSGTRCWLDAFERWVDAHDACVRPVEARYGSPENRLRGERAGLVLRDYALGTGARTRDGEWADDPADVLIDLLTDLMHWASHSGELGDEDDDFAELLRAAARNHTDELRDAREDQESDDDDE